MNSSVWQPINTQVNDPEVFKSRKLMGDVPVHRLSAFLPEGPRLKRFGVFAFLAAY